MPAVDPLRYVRGWKGKKKDVGKTGTDRPTKDKTNNSCEALP